MNRSELIENGDNTKLQINEKGLIFPTHPQSLHLNTGTKQVLNWRNNYLHPTNARKSSEK